jgi:hypothetical protein
MVRIGSELFYCLLKVSQKFDEITKFSVKFSITNPEVFISYKVAFILSKLASNFYAVPITTA